MAKHRDDRDIIEFFVRLILRETSLQDEVWTDSLPQPGTHLHVVADGYVTRSKPRLRRPWLETLSPLLTANEPTLTPCGLSYTRPGFHYGEPHTDIPLLVKGPLLFDPYRPTPEYKTVGYSGFSVGAHVLTIGLANCITDLDSETLASVRALILVQPPISLSLQYLNAARNVQPLPRLLSDFLADPMGLQNTFLRSIQKIRDAGVPVYFLYWPNDSFAPYTEPFLGTVKSCVTSFEALDNLVPATENTFLQHAEVAAHDETLRSLRRVISELDLSERSNIP